MPNAKCRGGRLILHLAFCITCITVLAQQPGPTFHTEANYVRVDVYPTVDGQPVLDLRQDDFELLEDGKPQNHRAVRARRHSRAGRA